MIEKEKLLKKQYCKNSSMLKELEMYNTTGIISEELGQMFIDITVRLCGHSYFRSYSPYVKDELRSAAIEKMILGVDKYNMKFSNPFAYFTQIAFNSFIQTCKKHYKYLNIRRKIATNYFMSVENTTLLNSNSVTINYLKNIIDND